MAEPGLESRLAAFLLPGAASALQAGKRRGRWPRSLSYLLSQAPLRRPCPWAPASALEPNLTPAFCFSAPANSSRREQRRLQRLALGGGGQWALAGESKVDRNPLKGPDL